MAKFLVILAIVVICLVIGAYILMLSWNYAGVAALTVAKPIGFWHALVAMLFLLPFLRNTASSSN